MLSFACVHCGQRMKVTEDGECMFCSDCAKTAEEFKTELKDKDLAKEFKEIRDIQDPQAKAERLAEFREKLLQERQRLQTEAPKEAPEEGQTGKTEEGTGEKTEEGTGEKTEGEKTKEGEGEKTEEQPAEPGKLPRHKASAFW